MSYNKGDPIMSCVKTLPSSEMLKKILSMDRTSGLSLSANRLKIHLMILIRVSESSQSDEVCGDIGC